MNNNSDSEYLEEMYMVAKGDGLWVDNDTYVHPLECRHYDNDKGRYVPVLTEQGNLLLRVIRRHLFTKEE